MRARTSHLLVVERLADESRPSAPHAPAANRAGRDSGSSASRPLSARPIVASLGSLPSRGPTSPAMVSPCSRTHCAIARPRRFPPTVAAAISPGSSAHGYLTPRLALGSGTSPSASIIAV